MEKTELLEQLKLNLGITTDRQNERLLNLIEALIQESKNLHGIEIDLGRLDHSMFILDYASYRYTAMTDDMPQHLIFRLRHLYVSEGSHVGT